jgi:DNA-binding transcriptional MerR regulator
MLEIKNKIISLLKEADVSNEEIEEFMEFHKQGLEGKLMEEIKNMKEHELKEVVGGMLSLFELTKKVKENEGNPLMGLMLLNMLNNLKK